MNECPLVINWCNRLTASSELKAITGLRHTWRWHSNSYPLHLSFIFAPIRQWGRGGGRRLLGKASICAAHLQTGRGLQSPAGCKDQSRPTEWKPSLNRNQSSSLKSVSLDTQVTASSTKMAAALLATVNSFPISVWQAYIRTLPTMPETCSKAHLTKTDI